MKNKAVTAARLIKPKTNLLTQVATTSANHSSRIPLWSKTRVTAPLPDALSLLGYGSDLPHYYEPASSISSIIKELKITDKSDKKQNAQTAFLVQSKDQIDKFLGEIDDTSNLTRFIVERNSEAKKITDEQLINLASKCKKLEIVFLPGCENITDKGLESLAKSTGIEHLILDNCPKITSHGINAIAALPKLKHASMNGCKNISGANFSKMGMLLDLSLLDTDAQDVDLKEIAKLPALGSLLLGGCKDITASGLTCFSGRQIKTFPDFPNAESTLQLWLAGCEKLKTAAAKEILQGISNASPGIRLIGPDGVHMKAAQTQSKVVQ
jgi:hypothetical protein